MTINTGAPVLTLGGKPYQFDNADLRVGQVIAESLATDPSGGKFKMYTLANKFYNEDSVEVDAADLALVKKAVEECKTYSNIISGQVLGILNDAK